MSRCKTNYHSKDLYYSDFAVCFYILSTVFHDKGTRFAVE